MIKKIRFLILLILCSRFSFSQFNDSVHHRFSLSSSGILNKTNDVSSYVLNNLALFEINQKKISFNTAANWIYGRQQKRLTNNDFSFFANVDYLKDVHRLYYWSLVNFDDSYSLKINYRFQSGLGIGFSLVKKSHFSFVVSDGFVYESSDLTDPVLGKDIYETVRNSLRIKYHWSYRNVITLEGANFAQPSVISFKDYILKLNNTLSVKLNKWLSLNAACSYNKISRTNRENLLITYGLTIDKYF